MTSIFPASGRGRRGYADGPHGQVHFQDAGTGTPLLLCSQAPLTHRQFGAVFGLLARRGIRPIAIDTPGFGHSDAPGDVPTIGDYAQVVPAVLDALGIARADMLGHHTGALIATEASLLYPDRIDRLILNGPLPLTPEENAFLTDLIVPKERGFAPVSGGAHLAGLFASRERVAAGTLPLERVTGLTIETLMGTGPFWWGHNAAFTYDHAATIPRITHDTMILTNTGDEIYAQALETARMRPDFAFVALPGGGADVIDQMPELWTQAVAAFLSPRSCTSSGAERVI